MKNCTPLNYFLLIVLKPLNKVTKFIFSFFNSIVVKITAGHGC